jgi:hypothetical protein
VQVVDTAPPVLDGVPSDFGIDATSPSGAVLAYTTPSATDAVDGARPVTCLPATGAIAPVGETVVECFATDNGSKHRTGGLHNHRARCRRASVASVD